ncbi:hypothetical protein [Aminobacterium mobile]|uniref:hypothetical protein n=1 Tax=Aminobacterium mobile TaxID=81467 RepID=UPI0012EC4EC8|nr:hypothetical protein [Aminobacterium mobile]
MAKEEEKGNICMHCHAIYQDFCGVFPPDVREIFGKSQVEKVEKVEKEKSDESGTDDIEKIIESIYFLFLEKNLSLGVADEKMIKILILSGKTIAKIKDLLIKFSPNIKKMDMSAQKNDEYMNIKIAKVAKKLEKEEIEKEIQKISGMEVPEKNEDEEEEIELIY